MNDTTIHSPSPDQSNRAESGAHQQVVKIEWPPLPSWVIPAIIACVAILSASLVATGMLWTRYEDLRNTMEVKTRLNAEHLTQYENTTGSWLVGQVQTNNQLIQTYGIGKACRRAK